MTTIPCFKILEGLQIYPSLLENMESHVNGMIRHHFNEEIWLLEHASVYTLGSSGHISDILSQNSLPIFFTNRGGQVTYHGPGQRIGYIMLDLKRCKRDLRRFIFLIEEWLIEVLGKFKISGERHQNRICVWVKMKDGQEAKIAAIGIRVKKWISYHGFALNVNPDLTHYNNIIACGLPQYKATSLHALGCHASLKEIDDQLIKTFPKIFNT